MKSRPPKALVKASRSEKERLEKEQLKEIRAALLRPLVTYGSYDWASRARQAEEAERMNSVAASLRSRYAEANELHTETVRRRWEALKVAYPADFGEAYDSLSVGDPAGLETALRFLEADPWFFRTGYIKADFIKWISRLDLKEREKARLRDVVLHAVDSRDRREFRAYCRLARKVDDPSLRAALTGRLENEERDVRRRARWVLEALGVLPPGPNESWVAWATRKLGSDNEYKRALGEAILRGEGHEDLIDPAEGDNNES